MLEVYSWPTPNGHKIHIMLEECGLPHRIHPSTSARVRNSTLDFRPSARTTRSRALRDPDGPDGEPISPLFESGAILLYLASKTGFGLPASTSQQSRGAAVADVPDGRRGLMLRAGASLSALRARETPYAIDRYTNEAKRLYGVINKRLARSTYLGGPAYSIADIATFPWLRSRKNQGVEMNDYPTSGLVRRDRQAPCRGAAWLRLKKPRAADRCGA